MPNCLPDALVAFEPNAARGRQLDRIVHEDYARSIAHIAEVCATTAGWESLAEAIREEPQHIADGATRPPEAFGIYYQLASAVIAGDRAAAEEAARLIPVLTDRGHDLRIHDRGAAGMLDQVFDMREGAGAARFAPQRLGLEAEFRGLLAEGLAILDAGLPELAGEVRAIVRDILLAEAPEGAKIEFDGASHYQFWGLLLLNPKHHRTPVAVAEVLAHEAGHSLLFGLTREEPLVLNPDDALFPSPLRRDPRPMDGIYHATFVSARMGWAMEALAESGVLGPAEAEEARQSAKVDRENFDKGLGVIRADGDLTDTGRAILAGAEAAMDRLR